MTAKWTRDPTSEPGRYIFGDEVINVENDFKSVGGWFFGPIPNEPEENGEEFEGKCNRSYGFKCKDYPGNSEICEHCPYWQE